MRLEHFLKVDNVDAERMSSGTVLGDRTSHTKLYWNLTVLLSACLTVTMAKQKRIPRGLHQKIIFPRLDPAVDDDETTRWYRSMWNSVTHCNTYILLSVQCITMELNRVQNHCYLATVLMHAHHRVWHAIVDEALINIVHISNFLVIEQYCFLWGYVVCSVARAGVFPLDLDFLP